jgi:hypothetical protein
MAPATSEKTWSMKTVFKHLRSPSRAYPIIIFTGYLLLIGYYYWFLVPRRRADLLNQSVSRLAAVSDQIRSKMESLTSIFQTEIDNRETRVFPENQEGLDQLNVNVTPEFKFEKCEAREDLGEDSTATGDEITLEDTMRGGKVEAYWRWRGLVGKEKKGLCGRAALEDLVTPFLENISNNYFSDLAVALRNGEVFYAQRRTAARLGNLQDLLESSGAVQPGNTPAVLSFLDTRAKDSAKTGKNKEATEAEGSLAQVLRKSRRDAIAEYSSNTTLQELTLAGKKYVLVLQPISVATVPRDQSDDQRYRLSIVGLVDANELQARARSLPFAQLANVSGAIVLLLILFWPLLKLWKMGPAERFRRREILFITWSLLGSSLLLTTLILYNAKRRDHNTDNDRLENLGQLVDAHLRQEVDAALAALHVLSSPGTVRSTETKFSTLTKLLNDKEHPFPARIAHAWYPWLDQVFWASNTGIQSKKWTTQDHTTPPTNVGAFSWFQDVIRGRMWRLIYPPNSRLKTADGSPDFVMDSEYSPNTGDYHGVLLQPTQLEADLSVGAVVSPMISLAAPIAPPEYGFAIFDENGLVHFHTESGKNLRENLIQETDRQELIENSLSSGSERWFDAVYQGHPHRMYVRPLRAFENASWALAVFHDLSDRERFYQGVFEDAIILNAAYFLGIVVVTGLITWLLFSRHDPSHTYRLSAEATPSLLVLSGIYALLIGGFAVAYGGSREVLWTTTLVLPVLGVWITYGVLRYGHIQLRWIDAAYYRLSLMTSALVLLMLISVLPAMAFFRLAFYHGREPYVAAGQIRLAASLRKRIEQVQTYYRRVRTDQLAGMFEDDVAFLTRRLVNETLDRYDHMWSNLRDHRFVPVGARTRRMFGRCETWEDPVLCLFDRAYVSLFPRPRSAVSGHGGSSPWNWDEPAPDRLRMTQQTEGGPDPAEEGVNQRASVGSQWRAFLPIVSELPTYDHPNHVAFVELAIMVTAFGVLLYFMLFVRLGLAGAPLPMLNIAAVYDPAAFNTGNHLVLCIPRVPPQSLSAFVSSPKCQVHDFRDLLGTDGTAKTAITNAHTVVIHSLEDGIGNPTNHERTLQILEHLVHNQDHNIVIFSFLDPLYYLFESYAIGVSAENLLSYSRWTAVFSSFTRWRAPDEQRMSRFVLEDWCLVWDGCTAREKLALWQLATDGLVNRQNRFALDHLSERGLVEFDAAKQTIGLRKELSRFVSSDLPTREVLSMREARMDTAWHGLKWTLFSTAMAMPVFLALTWSQFWEGGIGQAAAVISAGAVTFQGVSKVIQLASGRASKTGDLA